MPSEIIGPGVERVDQLRSHHPDLSSGKSHDDERQRPEGQRRRTPDAAGNGARCYVEPKERVSLRQDQPPVSHRDNQASMARSLDKAGGQTDPLLTRKKEGRAHIGRISRLLLKQLAHFIQDAAGAVDLVVSLFENLTEPCMHR